MNVKQAVKAPEPQQQQHSLLAQPAIGAYRGQSLPNVNQMANGSIDLQVKFNVFLLAFHLFRADVGYYDHVIIIILTIYAAPYAQR